MRGSLFSSTPPLGFQYLPDWITVEEEKRLLSQIERLSFANVRMHGVTAKRRVVHYGWNYGYDSWTIEPTEPIPDWLMPVRRRAGALMGVSAEAVEEVLVTRYEPGAGIGWHRDAPMFGPMVVGLSLAGSCRLRFQRKVAGERETAEAILARRSSYLLTEGARFLWQHSIPPAKELRYSITFRTLKHR
jgi:alkylated DNA repair protein (DNA oxidative demethylase)